MKRGRKPFIAKNHITEFNKLRMDLGDDAISEEQFRGELRKCGIPCNKGFWIALKRSGLLLGKNGRYSFSKPRKPIYFTVLQDVYTTYITQQRIYVQRRKDKELAKKIAKDKDVQAAIKLLKQYNFEVYAPVGMLYAKV